jgi:DNA-binding NtrC family response regulator
MNLSVPMDLMEFSPSVVGLNSADRRPILVVSDTDAAHLAARRILEPNGWDVFSALNFEQSLVETQRRRMAVTLCEHELPCGRWTDLLQRSSSLAAPPRMVVFSRLTDERLWGEVLNVGAYDLLTFPFHRHELLRVASLAADSWALEMTRRNPRRALASRAQAATTAEVA